MAKTVIGLFDTMTEAQNVVKDLTDQGFDRNHIGLVANNATNASLKGTDSDGNTMDTTDRGNSAGEVAGTSAVGGTVVGGVVGALVGFGALAIPGIGPVIAAGTLATVLGSTALGAGIGAAAGGLIGALVGLGVPKEDAEYYNEGVRRGGTLVTVKADDDQAQDAYNIMQNHGAVDIDERGANWKNEGWKGYDNSEQPYAAEKVQDYQQSAMSSRPVQATKAAADNLKSDMDEAGQTLTGNRSAGGRMYTHVENRSAVGLNPSPTMTGSFASFDRDFRNHYQGMGDTNIAYEQYEPIYRYGYDLGSDSRYSDKDWSSVETEAHQQWDNKNPGNTWDKVKDSVRFAWDRARGAVSDVVNSDSNYRTM